MSHGAFVFPKSQSAARCLDQIEVLSKYLKCTPPPKGVMAMLGVFVDSVVATIMLRGLARPTPGVGGITLLQMPSYLTGNDLEEMVKAAFLEAPETSAFKNIPSDWFDERDFHQATVAQRALQARVDLVLKPFMGYVPFPNHATRA